MQIVIEIKDETYRHCKEFNSLTVKQVIEAEKAIKNGIPLPEGHGRLILENDAIKAIEFRDKELRKDPQYIRKRGYIDVLDIKKFIYAAPTIIKADKEDENADSD